MYTISVLKMLSSMTGRNDLSLKEHIDKMSKAPYKGEMVDLRDIFCSTLCKNSFNQNVKTSFQFEM